MRVTLTNPTRFPAASAPDHVSLHQAAENGVSCLPVNVTVNRTSTSTTGMTDWLVCDPMRIKTCRMRGASPNILFARWLMRYTGTVSSYGSATMVSSKDDHWTIADLLAGAGEGIGSPPAPPCADLVEAFQRGREAALRCRSHELCPYRRSIAPDLFQAWMGGYWSGSN